MRERNSDHPRPGKPARRDDRKPFGGKPGKSSGGKSSGNKPFGGKRFGDKRFGDKRPGKAGPWRSAPRDRDGPVVLYGWHTVKAALDNPQRRFLRLLATENAARRLTDDKVKFPLEPELVRPEDIAAIAGAQAVHQGLYAEADPLPSPELEDVATGGIVLVLDQITDPHNVGAILRSAAAFAVKAVVTTERHSPEATGVLAKAASGALEYVPIATVVNLARALDELHELNTFLVGLDSSGEADLAAAPLSAPLGLVIGAEGKGLRHLTRVHCDVIARLALPGRITSLNVSNATALALYVATAKLAMPP
jgi:23S rRNA (guanosine2251-2'-O)-methyltransferase